MDFMTCCPKCGKISYGDDVCTYCHTQMIKTNVTTSDFLQNTDLMEQCKQHITKNIVFKNPQFDKELFEKREAERNKILEDNYKRMQYEADHPTCPRCGSTALSANKKGFGLGKAAVGGLVFGGVGLLGGFVGSGKIEITCLNCGYRFKPGDL